MASSTFVTMLRALHAKVKTGTLEPHERSDYDRCRRQLMSVAFAAQGAAYGGLPRRGNVRVAMALKVEVVFGDRPPQSATTVDVSNEGFSALLAFAAGIGAAARFSIRVAGMDPIAGACRIVGVLKQGGIQRVSVAVDGLDAPSRERLELAIFDHLIQNLP